MKKSILFSIPLTLILASCGGGGSSTPAPSALVKVDSTNAKAISASAYDAGLMASDQRYAADFVRSASSPEDSADIAASLIGLTQVGMQYLDDARNSSTRTDTRASTTTEACDSGSVTITDGFDADNLIEPGEYLALNFNQCRLGADTFNGSMRLTVKSWVSESNFVMTVSMNVNSVIDGIALSASGGMELGLLSGANTVYTLKSSSLVGTVGADDFNMQNIDVRITETSLNFTADVSMDVSSSVIGGKVHVATGPAIVIGRFDAYPSTGTLMVTGADGTYVSLNADTGNMSTVILTIFDGAATTSDEIPWSQLGTTY